MSLIFTKANQPHAVITLLVTAVHAAIILFGLFSFNARSEHGAQIMMASLIDQPSTNNINIVTKAADFQQSQDRQSEKNLNAEEEKKRKDNQRHIKLGLPQSPCPIHLLRA
jgi:hypothetical protein